MSMESPSSGSFSKNRKEHLEGLSVFAKTGGSPEPEATLSLTELEDELIKRLELNIETINSEAYTLAADDPQREKLTNDARAINAQIDDIKKKRSTMQ